MRLLLLFFLVAANGLAQNTPPFLNQEAPDLALKGGLQTPGNAVPTLAGLRGKTVVMEFWATWCGACVAAILHLNGVAEQLKSQPVVFLSVTDEDAGVVRTFLKKRPMQSWIGIDRDSATFTRYGVLARPQTVLIDANGVLRAILEPQDVNAGMLRAAVAGSFPPSPNAGAAPAVVSMELAKWAPPPLLAALIRPAAPAAVSGFSPGWIGGAGGRIEYYGMTPTRLLTFADPRQPREDRIVAPEWFGRVRYDATTTVPAGRKDLQTALLRQALDDTFLLKTHREQRPAQVYVLSVAGRSKLKRSSAEFSNGFKLQPGVFTGAATSMERLTRVLSNNLGGREVIDATGMAGNYDFDLKWKAGDMESLNAALRTELGLTLREETRKREFLVVDKAVEPQTW